MSQTKKITEGAMCIALIGVALFINLQFGLILEYGFMWVLALPIILYTAKYGIKYGSLAVLGTSFIGIIIGSPFTTLFFLFSALAMGLFYGYGVYLKKNNGFLLCGLLVIEFITVVLNLTIFASMLGYDISSDFNTTLKMVQTFFGNIDNYLIKNIVLVVILFVPLATGIFEGVVIHLFTHLVMKKLKMDICPLKPINQIKIPRFVGYISLITFILYFIISKVKVTNIVSYPIILLFLITYCIEIFNGALYLIRKVMYPKKLMVILIVFLTVIPGINTVIYLYGIYNNILNKE